MGPNRPGFSQLTPKGLTATATYYYATNIIMQIAQLLQKKSDVAAYAKLSNEIKYSFNKMFFNNTTKQYGTGSQTSNAIALYMGLVEQANKQAVIENLVKDIRGRNNTLTAGDIGYRYVLKVLDEAGRSDVIFDMNNRSDVPGYGFQIAKGATALTESWQALPNVSNNHFMLGHIMEWFYEGLAGIGQEANSVGYKSIVIKPEVVGNVTSAKASYQSVYGLIVSDWKKEKNAFELNVAIPANTIASIHLPANKSSIITQNGVLIKLTKFEKGKAVISTGSGNYKFVVR